MRHPFRTTIAVACLATAAGAGVLRAQDSLPLKSARALRFTATQGTWIALDVSPDGKTIVFDLLGDLYTMPITGGRAAHLTTGLAYDAQPRFSPDGKRIVFVSDRSGGQNLWIASLDGTGVRQLTKGNDWLYISPVWSPDGKYIVVSRAQNRLAAKPWVYAVDGGTGTPIMAEPTQFKILGAAFGPDPRYIWFAQSNGDWQYYNDWQYNAIFPMYQLVVYDRETGTRTIMSAEHGSGIRPALSPDGKWLVYATRWEGKTGLRIRSLAGGTERWLAYPVQRDNQESRATLDVLPGYAFTPDSRAIVASYGGEIWRVPIDSSAPHKIPMSADVELAVGPEVRFAFRVNDSATVTSRHIRDGVPSPDGKRFAFTSLDRLWVMDLPNGTPHRLTNLEVGEFQPTWSPDGSAVAFVTWADRDGGHVYRVRADGAGPSTPQKLTATAALYEEPAWSPSGARIVLTRSAARDLQEAFGNEAQNPMIGAQFVWVDAGGCRERDKREKTEEDSRSGATPACEPHVIAPAGGRRAPHFTRDTSRIFAYSGADGLVSMRWDGTDVRSVLKVTGTRAVDAASPLPPPAEMIRMSPRGDRAVVQVMNLLYMVDVPQFGGPVPTVALANLENASVPVRRLSDMGGQFPAWSADGNTIHWSLGNAHFTYSVDARTTTERAIAISAPRDVPRGEAVLRGARVITMRGTEILSDADIVVQGNRITAVGARGSVTVPNGARVIDVAGKTIVPGFVDTHYHAQWLPPTIHVQQPWQYLATLAYGVTTTRDPQSATTDIFAYQELVETGAMIGPRVYTTGPGVFATYVIRNLNDARDLVRRYATYFDTKTLKMYLTGNRAQREWILMACKELGLMPTTEGGLDFGLALTHAMDGYPGIEHSLEIVPTYNDVVELFNGTQTTHTPTLLVSYGGPWGENFYYATENVLGDPKLRHFMPERELSWKTRRRGTGAGGSPGPGGWFMPDEYIFVQQAEFDKRLIEAGGRVGVGSHGQIQGIGYQWELRSMASGGMKPHDVLRAATILGAEGIGFGKDLGSIEVGKLADLVVLDADPLADIKNANTIRYVMKNGRLYDGATLDELWPRQRKLPVQLWQENAMPRAGIREP
ncbi:MAG: amidohydrolase family protein [Gemmatimonadaceae bacterium]